MGRGFRKARFALPGSDRFLQSEDAFLEWRRKDAEKIPKEKVRLFFLARIFDIVARRLIKDFSYYEQVFFDAWASKHIGSGDIVITRSMCALKTMEAAKRMGAKTVMYRGSSHIESSEGRKRKRISKAWHNLSIPEQPEQDKKRARGIRIMRCALHPLVICRQNLRGARRSRRKNHSLPPERGGGSCNFRRRNIGEE